MGGGDLGAFAAALLPVCLLGMLTGPVVGSLGSRVEYPGGGDSMREIGDVGVSMPGNAIRLAAPAVSILPGGGMERMAGLVGAIWPVCVRSRGEAGGSCDSVVDRASVLV